jgi:ribosome-associated protein
VTATQWLDTAEVAERTGWTRVKPAASGRAIELARVAAAAAADKLGQDIVAIDVTSRLPFADIFLIVTGTNDRQVGAITDAVEEKLLAYGAKRSGREGDQEARWVLLDFLDLIVHVQHTDARTLFALERLWHDCPTIELGV